MSNKSIILSLIIFLLFSLGFLAYTETQQQSPTSQNWWVVYFSNPKDESLDFVIENNSNETIFHYKILDEKNNLLKGENTQIAKGTQKEISPIENLGSKKIIIQISAGDEKREIYKNFDK